MKPQNRYFSYIEQRNRGEKGEFVSELFYISTLFASLVEKRLLEVFVVALLPQHEHSQNDNDDDQKHANRSNHNHRNLHPAHRGSTVVRSARVRSSCSPVVSRSSGIETRI